jgi:hypothetical protein
MFFGPGGVRMGAPNSSAMLLEMAEVQKELAVTDAQKEKITALQADARAAMDKAMQDFDPRAAQDLEPEEREKRMAEMRAKMEENNKKMDERVAEMLDAKQLARLKQLRLQREGVGALTRGDIAEKLVLTDEQKKKINGEQPSFNFGPPRPNPRAMTNALAHLTDEQKAKWTELTGAEFKFPQNAFGPPGFGGQERKLVKDHDKDGDGKLSFEERKAARVAAKAQPSGRRGPGGPGGPGPGGPGGRGPGGPGGRGPGGPGRGAEPGKPGPRVSPEDVKSFPEAGLYDPSVLRTLFLEFENEDWETELSDFHNTDVDVPATLTVDGKRYPGVGIHFRGMSSYGMVPAGSKRSLNVSVDFGDSKQRLLGYKTLNLLNAHEDPSFMHTVLYSAIARKHIAAPKANFVKVVINGESWGVYVNAQQFDKNFLAENYSSDKGTRWKVRGSPGGDGGLRYLGDDVAEYKRRYEIKSPENDGAWRAMIKLCKTLDETPADKLEAALAPMLDIDGVLWFLALDNGLINGDGYWVRASDYCIYLDQQGKFHVIPHDMNEAFHAPMGPGAMGGRGGPGGGGPGGSGPGGAPGGGGLALDPLIGLDDDSKPLRSKLLAVPALRTKYLQCVRAIAEESLDWNKLGPQVAGYKSLIEKELAADTRKLSSLAAFEQAVSDVTPPEADAEGGRGRRRESLRTFAEQRRLALLGHPEIKALAKP